MLIPYLYSKHVGEKTAEDAAPEGEPVIPAFPIIENINTFVSGVSFKPSYYAQVIKQEFDIDRFGDRVKKEYGDMPATMINAYIMAVVKACMHDLQAGDIVQAYITYDTTKLRNINTEDIIVLWNSHPQ